LAVRIQTLTENHVAVVIFDDHRRGLVRRAGVVGNVGERAVHSDKLMGTENRTGRHADRDVAGLALGQADDVERLIESFHAWPGHRCGVGSR